MMAENKRVSLRLAHVSKSFEKIETDEVTHALNEINLTMESGEFISLVGPSGCGKSTILRLVAGLIQPTTGKLTVDGKTITEPSPERGMVFQKPTLFPWLTVWDNIAFSLRMQGRLKGNKDKVERMIKVIGLEKFRNDYPGQLSGALDAFTRMNMQDEILKIWQEKEQLAIMVTHDVDEAIYMGTRVIVLDANPGRVVADIQIKEPFPRDRSSDTFVQYRNEILNRLHFAGRG